ncbi:MAG: hypothetical protein IJ880_17185 [Bacilli bacterium]|nr:hypothetical protein [Bacilli bacterium]
MNTYLLPVVDDDYNPFIMKVVAKGYNEAKDMFIKKFYEDFEWDYSDDWDDLVKQAIDRDWNIGEISDKDDF